MLVVKLWNLDLKWSIKSELTLWAFYNKYTFIPSSEELYQVKIYFQSLIINSDPANHKELEKLCSLQKLLLTWQSGEPLQYSVSSKYRVWWSCNKMTKCGTDSVGTAQSNPASWWTDISATGSAGTDPTDHHSTATDRSHCRTEPGDFILSCIYGNIKEHPL